MTSEEKIKFIRSYGFWVRVCDKEAGSPVKYIIVDPDDDEEGWMRAGDEDALDDTVDLLSYHAQLNVIPNDS